MRVRATSKYYPLYLALKAYAGDQVEMTFGQIERLMDEKLPVSARSARAFWSNRQTGYQSQAWLKNDLLVDSVDLEGEKVRWRRIGRGYRVRTENDGIRWDSEAVRALREHMNLSQEELAELMGVRQQTISEWETGAYEPGRSSAKHLGMVAEQARFPYRVKAESRTENGE